MNALTKRAFFRTQSNGSPRSWRKHLAPGEAEPGEFASAEPEPARPEADMEYRWFELSVALFEGLCASRAAPGFRFASSGATPSPASQAVSCARTTYSAKP